MTTQRRNIVWVVVLLSAGLGADWTRFRGPDGNAISTDKGVPAQWTESGNVAWRTKLPGSGSSSPITLGNRIFLTCYSGYGVDDQEGDMSELRRHVVCVDRKSGQILWNKEFNPNLPEVPYSGYMALHGYASSTPATDGKHLFVFFGKSGVYCLDLDGKVVWHKSVGGRTHGWGSATSPILYQDLVIVNASVESGAIVALNKSNGEEQWRADGMKNSWNTPVLVSPSPPRGEGKGVRGTELVFAASNKMIGLDPATGKELWFANVYDWYVCPSVVAHDGVVYGLQHSIAVAVRCGGRGDVTSTHTLWRENIGAVVSSCVYHDGDIYWMRDGACYCLDALTGKSQYRQGVRPGAGTVYASPIVADGKIYYVSQGNGIYVIAAGRTFEQLAHNVFADDQSRTNASPLVSDGSLLVRTDRYLYCIGAK